MDIVPVKIVGGDPSGSTNPVAVTCAPATTLVDRSGTITTGGTAQVLCAANASRKGILIQNLSNGDLWINSLGTATAGVGSLKISSGVYWESPFGGAGVGAVSILGATTAQAFTAREW